jgi:predicted enzyme related to lactoylglutathione lyase
MGRPVVHFEIGGRDRARSAEFYGALFGWTTREMGEASMIDTGAGSGIPGHFTALGHEPYRYVTVYVDVDDVPGYLANAESLGGETLIPPVEIPQGTFAWFKDLDGNVIGLWHAKPAA